MATRRYSINPEDATFQVTEAAGAAVATKLIEVTVDFTALAAAGIGDTLAKNQVVDCLTRISEYITKGVWPPA